MTIRKYDKIRENILSIQQLNTKRYEKEIIINPGPDHYVPNYNLVENNGYSVINIFIFLYAIFILFSFNSFYFISFILYNLLLYNTIS
jgi:hypothetical protein